MSTFNIANHKVLCGWIFLDLVILPGLWSKNIHIQTECSSYIYLHKAFDLSLKYMTPKSINGSIGLHRLLWRVMLQIYIINFPPVLLMFYGYHSRTLLKCIL